MSRSFTRDVFRYSFLVRGGGHASRITTHTSLSLSHVIAVILTLLFVATAGFFAGRLSHTDFNQHVIQREFDSILKWLYKPPMVTLQIIVTTKPEVFSYNRTFGEAPSNASDSAWFSLFPEQGGFFKHPTIAPQRSAFSVFHQLHCLVCKNSTVLLTRTYLIHMQDGIRKGYWAIHVAATEGQQIADDLLPFMSSPPHIRHCIDLIRHSLMCRPDLTVEIKEEELGGVRGFGTEHQCQNWDELIAWISRWESYKQDPSSKEKHKLHHNDHA